MELTFAENKTALVTGAGRGIGRVIALQLGAAGFEVICVSRSATGQAVADEIVAAGGKATGLAVDVGDKAAVREASQQLLETYKVVDVIVNNAGITKDNLVLRMSEEDYDEVLQTNLSSSYYWVKNLLQPMTRARWGRIVNVSSVIGLMGNAGQANYASAKAGMHGLTKSLAKELASRNITANAVAPGFIETDMTAKLNEDAQQAIKKAIPLKRMGTAEDIANAVSFLVSDQASYITGQVFTVDGGMVM